MIYYLDTSVVVPMLVAEQTSDACRELWEAADAVTSTRLLYVETAAALATAQRRDRISGAHARKARSVLDELWLAVDVIELGGQLMTGAAAMAAAHGLRGYDATHCAAATLVNDIELVAASGDARLLAAWRAEGVAVRDTTS